MKTVRYTGENNQAVINTALAALRAGGLVIFPTETTYGAGVDATNQAAVDKLLGYKSRREGKPLSIAVPDMQMAEQFVELTDSARKLYQRFLPGPVTVVSHSLGKVAQGVESEFGTLGVRIPDYPLITQLVAALDRPMTATSANASDAKRPYTIQDIFEGLSEKQKTLIDLVIDAGQLPPNPPSTVIDTTLSTPVVFRQGEVKMAADSPQTELISTSEAETKAIAGKLLLKHWNEIRAQGLVIALDGSLGVGKTIFVKGLAEFLGISETITSPTYTYIEEYDFTRHQTSGQLYHLDLWKVDSAGQLERLEISKLFKPNTVIAIEWFNQVEEWLLPHITTAKIPLIGVDLEQAGTNRKISLFDAS